jgi:hypothetical protein
MIGVLGTDLEGDVVVVPSMRRFLVKSPVVRDFAGKVAGDGGDVAAALCMNYM